jgi:small-conductance mechanosensitive channel
MRCDEKEVAMLTISEMGARTAEPALFAGRSWLGLVVAIVIALAATAIAIGVSSLLVRPAAKRKAWARSLVTTTRYPYRLLIVTVALWIAVALSLPERSWLDTINHGFLIVVMAACTWLIAAHVSFLLGVALARYPINVPDNRTARRMTTRILIIRRFVVVAIALVGLAAILLTFPGVRSVGTSVLASAGILSIIAGLAAQSSLANVFAGLQLAFSDALRMDDVVVVLDTVWGRIEDITLTYVVVHVWDDTRVVLPSTYFTTTPFQNWTRNSSQLLGSVEFDLGWRVSPVEMREELDRIVHRTPLWDGRTSVLQVTDAEGGYVHIRVLVTAADSPALFDLRCFVRENLVEWIHTKDPAGLPRTRVELIGDLPRAHDGAASKPSATQAEHAGLFTGTADAEERASQFTTPIQTIRLPEPGRAAPSRAEAGSADEGSSEQGGSQRGGSQQGGSERGGPGQGGPGKDATGSAAS